MRKLKLKVRIKHILTLSLFILPTQLIVSQVGINTLKPKTDLDVNGEITIRGPLRLGPNGNPGNEGDLLVSKGLASPPEWQPINSTIGGDNNKYSLTNVFSKESRQGISLSTNNPTFWASDNMVLDESVWTKLSDLEYSFGVVDDKSFALISVQTSVTSDYLISSQSSSDINVVGSLYIDFVGAVFVKAPGESDYKLVTGRQGRLTGYRNPEMEFTLFYTLDNLRLGSYDIIVAFFRLTSDNNTNGMSKANLNIGGVTTTKDNPFMTKTSLMINLYSPNGN